MSELSFGERDRCGLYTLLENDIVQFIIAKDKRDGMMRATQIALLDQSFLKSKEQRQMVDQQPWWCASRTFLSLLRAPF